MQTGHFSNWFILILILLFSFPALAQQKAIDSLKAELAHYEAQKKELGAGASPKNDTVKVLLLDKIINLYFQELPVKALPLAREELRLSEKLKYEWGIGQANNALGAIADFKSDYATAIQYYKKSLQVKLRTGDVQGQIDTFNNLGIAYSKLSQYNLALATMQKGLELSNRAKDGFGIYASSNNIGLVYRNQGQNDLALKTYFRCLELQKRLKHSYKVSMVYHNIGDIYLLQHKPGPAMDYFLKGLQAAHQDGDLEAQADLGSGLGRVYIEKQQYAQSLNFFQKALAIYRQIENPLGIADTKILMGWANFKSGHPEKAISGILEGLKTVKENGELETAKIAYDYLSKIYAATGQYKLALDHQILFRQLQDSIFNIEKEAKFRELQVKFDLKSVQEKARVKEAAAQSALQSQKHIRNAVFAVMAVIVIFLVVLLWQRSKLSEIRREKALEQERNRISRDLHDNLGAQLSTARLFISSLKEQSDREMREKVNNSIVLLDDSINDLRTIMNERHQSLLQEKGYLAATEALVNKVNALHLIRFALSNHNLPSRFEPRTEQELYRITQELINNTLKYAQAKTVTIDLLERDRMLVFMYEDDGIGYDPKSVKRGNGLDNLSTRVAALGGTLEIDATPGAGARTIIEIPLKNAR